MSSYIDHHGEPPYVPGKTYDPVYITHAWADFTRRRLEWLYGPAQSIERRAMTQADIAAWRSLGRRSAA